MCCYGKLEKKEKLPAEPNEEKLPIQLPYEDPRSLHMKAFEANPMDRSSILILIFSSPDI